MKKLLSVCLLNLFIINGHAQGIQGLVNKVKQSVPGGASKTGLSNDDIISGLKDALRVGADSTTAKLSKTNGFFGDAAIKILMPPEAQKVEKTLRGMGMGDMVDKAILSMNRAAEDASKGVGDIFWNSIKSIVLRMVFQF